MDEGLSGAGSRTTSARRCSIPSPIRAGSVAVLAAIAAGAGLALARGPLLQVRAALADGTPWQALPLALLLAAACATALAACCVWLLTITLATTLEAVTGLSTAALRALTPRAVRRGVLLACGFAVGSAAVVGPATAATEAGPAASLGGTAAAVLELDGLPLPDRSLGDLRAPATDVQPLAIDQRATRAGSGARSGPGAREAPGAASSSPALSLSPSGRFRAATAAQPGPGSRSRYEVQPGDSLWSIARRLRPRAGLGEIDRSWRRVYQVNRPTIGDDPDLLIPGTTLRLVVRPLSARRLDGPPGPDPLPHRKDPS